MKFDIMPDQPKPGSTYLGTVMEPPNYIPLEVLFSNEQWFKCPEGTVSCEQKGRDWFFKRKEKEKEK